MYPPQAPTAVPAAPLAPTPKLLPEETDLEMAPEDVRQWWGRIELDRARRARESENWRNLLREFLPRKEGGKWPINSNIHFRNVQLKCAEVWAQMPELMLSPLSPLAEIPDPQTGQLMNPSDIVAVKRAVLNKLLGRDYADVDLTIREALFDIFMTSGIGATKICYEADVQRDTGAPTTPPPGSILGLNAMPPVPPVVINERIRWYRFSPEKLIIPHDFHSTRWDEAPYLGMEFTEAITPQTLEAYNLPPNFQSNVTRDDQIMSPDRDLVQAGKAKLLRGIELWLYAYYFDPTVSNRQIMRRLVLIEGQKEKAAIYRQSPYQRVDQTGKLTPDSMVGNPIHPITLRVASDTAYVPSDAAFTDPLVRIENTMMDQDIALRDANLPRFFHHPLIAAAVDKLKNIATGMGVELPNSVAGLPADRLIIPVPHLERAQSDETMRANVERKQDQTLGISPNQAGAYTKAARSATESAIVQQNVSVRLKSEQSILLGRVLVGVRKVDALIQQFWDQQDYIEIVGQDGARKLVAYASAHLAGRYAFDAYPDSQLTIDNESHIQHFETFVNFMAKSGWVNLGAVGNTWSDLMGYGGKGFIQQPQPPPEPPPEKPKVSVALKASDLAIPEVRLLLKVEGIDLTMLPVSPELAQAHALEQAKNQPHGGAMPQADTVEKHAAQETGHQAGVPPLAPAQPVPAAMPPAPQRPQ